MLTPEEKVKCRHHLGYLNVQQAQTYFLGIPAAVQTQFMIEGAMDRVLLDAEPELRRHLQILDDTEQQMLDDLELLAVTQVDEIGIRPDEQVQLRIQYQYWRRGLANILGIIPNPWDQRYGMGSGINVPVQH